MAIIRSKYQVNGGESFGFSLLELLVVLIIIGVGWFSILPNLDLASSETRKDEYAELNAFLEEVREKAVSSYHTQAVFVTIDGSTLFWADQELDLPGEVRSCQINRLDPSVFGDSFAFRVFRDGVMDQVRLEMADGTVLESDVIRVRFRAAEEEG